MRRKYRGSKQPGYHSGVKRDRRIRMRLPFAEIMVNRFSPIFGPEKKEWLSSLSLSLLDTAAGKKEQRLD